MKYFIVASAVILLFALLFGPKIDCGHSVPAGWNDGDREAAISKVCKKTCIEAAAKLGETNIDTLCPMCKGMNDETFVRCMKLDCVPLVTAVCEVCCETGTADQCSAIHGGGPK